MQSKCKYFVGLFIGAICLGQTNTDSLDIKMAPEMKEARANNLGDQSIHADGLLDEDVWETASWNSGFRQRQPGNGNPATLKTEFAIFYTDKFLYIGARAYDPEPDKISAILSRRDEYTESDWMYVSIDSYDDNRTAFEFGLNAAGVKHDIKRFNDTRSDWEYDANWDGNANIDEDGWTAEWKIPFNELRFTSSENMVWGFLFYREIPRFDSELSMWNWWSQADQGFVSRYGILTGLKNIDSRQPINVIPYVAGQANISDDLVTSYHEKDYDLLGTIGGDIKYSSSRGYTLTAAVNPDFGQVESDPAEFNLTNFESYFSERRPFFTEGSNIFQFRGGDGSFFYSRRIGRSPQGYLDYDAARNGVGGDVPDMTNILAAAKITGKSVKGLSIGLLEAITAEEKGKVYYEDGSTSRNVVEPLTNYLVTRIKKDFNEGQTNLGAIFTAVNRKLDGTGIDYLRQSAYTGGIDFDQNIFDQKYFLSGGISFSNVQGDTTAIQYTQKSSSRNFHRPDADHLSYDPTLTSLSGFAMNGMFGKNSGHFRGEIGLQTFSPGYEINDIGYNRRVDYSQQWVHVQYFQWEPGKYFQNYRLNVTEWSIYDYDGLKTQGGINSFLNFKLLNQWNLYGGINRTMSGWNTSYNRGGPVLRTPSGMNMWGGLSSDRRKDLFAFIEGGGLKNADNVTSLWSALEVKLRLMQNFALSGNINYNKFDDTWAWVGKKYYNNETLYLWAALNQQTMNITFRLDWTIKNDLTIQYYAQPYVTAGKYFDFLEVDDNTALDFNKRFRKIETEYVDSLGVYFVDRNFDGEPDYTFWGGKDFNYKQFRSNLVLRWEYSTGSVLYLVWSQGFTDYELFKPFDYRKNINTLFDGVGNNVLMLKISHALNL